MLNFSRASRVLVMLLVTAGLGACASTGQAESTTGVVKSVKFDDIKDINAQLQKGLDPNTLDEHGDPLIVIAAREKSDQVGLALASAPNINLEATDRAGETALMLAALNGDMKLTQALIDKGAQVNRKGWTPLHYAATKGHDDVARLLIDKSAEIDAGSPNGTTPLMMAARGDYLSTIKLLLDKGANPNAKNQLGLRAIDFAKHYQAPDAIKFLSSLPGAAAPATQNSAQ